MSVQKIYNTFAPGQVLKSSEMNQIVSTINDVIDNLGGTSSGGTTEIYSNVYYGVSKESSTSTTHTIKISDFKLGSSDGTTPVDGCVVFVKFEYAHTVDSLYLIIEQSNSSKSKSYPVYLNGKPISKDDIQEGAVVSMVFSSNDSHYNVCGGTGVNFPIVCVPTTYTLEGILNGLYANGGASSLAYGLYKELNDNYIAHRIMMLYNASSGYIMLDFNTIDEDNNMVFSAVYAGKYYEFAASPAGFIVNDDGSDIVTAWKNE